MDRWLKRAADYRYCVALALLALGMALVESCGVLCAAFGVIVVLLQLIGEYAARSAAEELRKGAIGEATRVLQNRVNNHLTVVRHFGGSSDPREAELADDSIRAISSLVNNLDVEAIDRWNRHYSASAGADAGNRPAGSRR